MVGKDLVADPMHLPSKNAWRAQPVSTLFLLNFYRTGAGPSWSNLNDVSEFG